MFIRHPLVDLFGGNRARVLESFLLIEGEATVRQVSRSTGLAASSCSLTLRTLETSGILVSREIGGALAYSLNRQHFAVPALLEIAQRADAAVEELVRRVARALPKAPASIMLFGSVARGDETPDSDIDLLLIARDGRELGSSDALYDLAQDLGAWLGRRVNLVASARPSTRDLRNAFWREVLRDGRILAGGSPTHLAG